MKRIWFVPLLIAFGAIFAWAKAGGHGPKTYELRTKTEIVQGIRETPYTDYWYDEVQGSSHTTLWHTRRMEKYSKHWISPSGHVWILTDSFTGPGGGSNIWVGDTKRMYEEYRFTGLSRTSVVTVSGIAETIRGGAGELLDLNKGTPDERKLLLVDVPGNPKLALDQEPSTSPRKFLVEDALRAKDLNNPVITKVGDDNRGTYLLVFNSTAPGKPDTAILLGTNSNMFAQDATSMKVIVERGLKAAPEQIYSSPSAYLAYFLFEPDGAWFDVCDGNGELLYRTDLKKSGKFSSVSEAKSHILRTVSYWNPSEGWQALPHKYPNYYTRNYDKFDFYDSSSRRYEVSLYTSLDHHVTGQVEVQKGVAARRQIFNEFKPSETLWERNAESPNKVFHVKVKGTTWSPDPSQTYVVITLTATVMDDGKPVEVQISQTSTYGDAWAKVTDSGRVFVLELGKTNTETERNVDRADLLVFGAGEINSGGIGLLKDRGASFGVATYANNEAVKKGILFDQMKIVSHGKKMTQRFQGVDLPLWEVEEFWVPQTSGEPIHQAIINGNFAPSTIQNGKKKLLIPDN